MSTPLHSTAGTAQPKSAAGPAVSRKTITDRLGLPADASDERVLAAVDRAKARADERAGANAEARAEVDALVHDHALYATAWGRPSAHQRAATAAPAARQLDARELYALAWPGDSTQVDGLDVYPAGGGAR